MLHLNAGIHFDEVEAAVFVSQEFHRARIGVTHLLQDLDYAPTEIGAAFFRP